MKQDIYVPIFVLKVYVLKLYLMDNKLGALDQAGTTSQLEHLARAKLDELETLDLSNNKFSDFNSIQALVRRWLSCFVRGGGREGETFF